MVGHRMAALALGLLALLTACGEPADVDNLPLPGQPVGEWTQLVGAEGTVCANGSDYSYYAYKGTINKLVIDFQGGGACWDDATCTQGVSTVGPDFLYLDVVTVPETTLEQGIYDHSRDDNPIQDWYHVFIPYCTGDIHIGNAINTYAVPGTEATYTVQHKGAVNARSVLDWTFENFTEPEQIFVTGCSGGGYGAAYWTEEIAAQYPGIDIVQLGDCAAGVSSDAFSEILANSWDTSATFPELTFDADVVDEVYQNAAAAYPDLRLAQYHTLFDPVQINFYAAGTGRDTSPEVAAEWSGAVQASMTTLANELDNFSFYVSDFDDDSDPANGTAHCIITKDAIYNEEVNGVKFTDWLTSYLAGEEVADVSAE